jgi:hypothetical protein
VEAPAADTPGVVKGLNLVPRKVKFVEGTVATELGVENDGRLDVVVVVVVPLIVTEEVVTSTYTGGIEGTNRDPGIGSSINRTW